MKLTTKFKVACKARKKWQRSLPRLDKIIGNVKLSIELLDNLEEHRDLSLEEWNFREILQNKIAIMLCLQKIY
jgi:hypothetical protein